MKECKRVIKPTGTIWINLGDSYAGNKEGNDDPKLNESVRKSGVSKKVTDIPNKSLMLIPHRFAIRCVDELGLILRNDIIWAKPNGMPESVTDRFSKKHEFIFFFVKSQKYFFDLDGVRDKSKPLDRWGGPKLKANGVSDWDKSTNQSSYRDRDMQPNNAMKNPGDVSDFWNITTKGSSDKHYATFNSELIDKPIVAGCPEFVCVKCGKPREKIIESEKYDYAKSKRQLTNVPNRSDSRHNTAEKPTLNKTITGLTDCNCKAGFTGGIVLDPFAGSGTTLQRVLQLNRNVIGIEASKEYFEIAEKKIEKELIKIRLF